MIALLALPALAIGPATVGAQTQAADTVATAPAVPSDDGFAMPVALIPELGLWVDGLSQVGFAKKTGLVLWWGLEPPAAVAGGSKSVDWRRITYRIRAQAFDRRGKRSAHEEELIEPLRSDGASETGGFPTLLRLDLAPGVYHVQLEAYPLISARAAGLDTVPRGMAEVTVTVRDMNVASTGWRLSDPLFLRSVRRWEPGTSSERTWYEWIAHPDVPRLFRPDSATTHLAFEILRSSEVVPRCAPGACRVVVTFRDGDGGVVQQELRPVPAPGEVSAYLVPFRPGELRPGDYRVEIEVYDGAELQAMVQRRFRVLETSG